jgi:hypothetical protein
MAGEAPTANEYDLKAAFLFNFTRFVEWPRGAPDVPFCIGVAGQDPFHGALEQAVTGRSAAGRAIVVRRLRTGDEAACEMLFIAGTDLYKARTMLVRLRGSPVLTVGEAPGFCRAGGIIEFSVQDRRVRLSVNLDAAQRAHLQISSKLLGVASVVRDSD